MAVKKVRCPRCDNLMRVELKPGQHSVRCPQCNSTYRLRLSLDKDAEDSPSEAPLPEEPKPATKLAAPEPPRPAPAPSDDDTDDIRFADAPQAALSAADANEEVVDLESITEVSRKAPDDDEIKLADDAPAPSPANVGDISSDPYALTPLDSAPQSRDTSANVSDDEFALAPAASAPKKPKPLKATQKAKRDAGQQVAKRRTAIALIMGGMAGCFVGLAILVGLGVWWFSGGAELDKEVIPITGDNLGGTELPSQVKQRLLAGDVTWLGDEYVVFDEAPEGAVFDAANRINFTSEPLARAAGAGGTDQQPAPWTAFPERQPPSPPDLRPLSQRPAAWGDEHYVAVESTVGDDSTSRRKTTDFWWRRFDLASDQPTGEAALISHVESRPVRGFPAPMMALSADGERVAAVDYVDRTLVHVWSADGESITDISGKETAWTVQWIGFGADGDLLTLVGGTLTAWSLPEAAPSWKLEEVGRNGRAVLSHERDWLAFAHGGEIDLVDVASGDSRGRLSYELGEAAFSLGIAPDQQRLACLFELDTDQYYDAAYVVWDLRTGAATSMKIGSLSGNARPQVHWLDNELLGVQHRPPSMGISLLHVFGQARLASFGMPGSERRRTGLSRSDASRLEPGPFDRLWLSDSGTRCFPVTFLSRDIAEHQPLFAAMEENRRSGNKKVRLEIDAGAAETSQRWGKAFAAYLTEFGVPLGQNGHTLRVRYGAANSESTVHDGTVNVPVPLLVSMWQLLDPDGNEVWKEVEWGVVWDRKRSKYVTERRNNRQFFKFPEDDARAAIIEEMLARDSIRTERVPKRVMTRLKRPGQYDVEFPLRLQIASPTTSELPVADSGE